MNNVSVIVPIYNTEKYIDRCVQSILNQTYQNFEILLIDDGSTDCSYEICRKYESLDNVRIFHQENKGLSATRNYGIKESNGDYVFYVDSDDYISKDCLETLVRMANKYDAKICAASFGFFNDHGAIGRKDCNSIEKCFSNISACKNLLYGKAFYTSSCNILIERNIALANLFPIGKFHEDEFTTFRYLLATSKAAFTTKITYYYYQRQGSIMHVCGKQVIDALRAADNYVTFMNKNIPSLVHAAENKKYSLYYTMIRDYPELKDTYPDEYKCAIEYLLKYKWKIVFLPYFNLGTKKNAIKLILKKIWFNKIKE